MIVVVCQWQYSLLGDHDLTNVHDHGGGRAVRGSRSASGRIPIQGQGREIAELQRLAGADDPPAGTMITCDLLTEW